VKAFGEHGGRAADGRRHEFGDGDPDIGEQCAEQNDILAEPARQISHAAQPG